MAGAHPRICEYARSGYAGKKFHIAMKNQRPAAQDMMSRGQPFELTFNRTLDMGHIQKTIQHHNHNLLQK